mmetsp:Transcript_33214/g.67010  ORF Transcript_33214/g.67010 Transcript_33214/m.67010 type:complete len:112 (-) Transcript_33214:254-589(-)
MMHSNAAVAAAAAAVLSTSGPTEPDFISEEELPRATNEELVEQIDCAIRFLNETSKRANALAMATDYVKFTKLPRAKQNVERLQRELAAAQRELAAAQEEVEDGEMAETTL